jgi:hypothetical protein
VESGVYPLAPASYHAEPMLARVPAPGAPIQWEVAGEMCVLQPDAYRITDGKVYLLASTRGWVRVFVTQISAPPSQSLVASGGLASMTLPPADPELTYEVEWQRNAGPWGESNLYQPGDIVAHEWSTATPEDVVRARYRLLGVLQPSAWTYSSTTPIWPVDSAAPVLSWTEGATHRDVVLSWTALQGAGHYRVQVLNEAGTVVRDFTVAHPASGGMVATVLSDLAPLTRYRIKVRTEAQNANGKWSDEVRVRTGQVEVWVQEPRYQGIYSPEGWLVGAHTYYVDVQTGWPTPAENW